MTRYRRGSELASVGLIRRRTRSVCPVCPSVSGYGTKLVLYYFCCGALDEGPLGPRSIRGRLIKPSVHGVFPGMSVITEEQVRAQLRTVNDPELHKDLVSLDMVKRIAIDGSRVLIDIELTTPACPLKQRIKSDIEQAIRRIEGVQAVEIRWSAQVHSSREDTTQLPGVKNIVAVGAGKGGVGKSMAAVLLAYGLRRKGASVGIMDADVYGPSIPTMTGIEGARPSMPDDLMVPPMAGDVKIMSIGFMVDRDRPLIWRGPMTHGVITQFLGQVDWGELDYLIVDLPPGTGDVPLSLAQLIPMTGAVVVCTPQDIALVDAR